jgi:chemotaxis protein CheC
MLTEVGNILLNACLTMLGNLLDTKVVFSVPLLNLQKLNVLVHSLVAGKSELRYALLVRTCVHLHENWVSGYVVVVLGVPSLHCLIKAIETWANIAKPARIAIGY